MLLQPCQRVANRSSGSLCALPREVAVPVKVVHQRVDTRGPPAVHEGGQVGGGRQSPHVAAGAHRDVEVAAEMSA